MNKILVILTITAMAFSALAQSRRMGGGSFGGGSHSSFSGGSRSSFGGNSHSSFGGGSPATRSAGPMSTKSNYANRSTSVGRTTTTYTATRRYQLGVRPSVHYSTTYVIGGRTVYWYPGGGYSYYAGGPVMGYYDPPMYNNGYNNGYNGTHTVYVQTSSGLWLVVLAVFIFLAFAGAVFIARRV